MPGDAPPIHMIPEFDAKPIVRTLAILLLSPAGRILNDVRVIGGCPDLAACVAQ